jgi:DNA primase
MGTAVTADQLGAIWAAHPEPVVALDGDKAGIRAAMRLVDLALPLVAAGKGLRFAVLPGGQDPDDLIRAGGAQAFRAVLDGARPLVALLWQRETEGQVFDSPERRAALDKRLRAALGQIADPGLRAHYADEIRALRGALFAPAPRARRPATPGRGPRAPFVDPSPSPALRASPLAAPGALSDEGLREAVVLATLARHPALLPRFEAALDRLDVADPDRAALRDALVAAAVADDPATAWVAARPALAALLARIERHPHVRAAPCVHHDATEALAALCVADDLERLAAGRAAFAEVEYAEAEIAQFDDEALTWRLARAAEARARACRTPLTDSGPDEPGETGSDIDRMLANEAWRKRRGGGR